ncbi:MAG: MFS transporter [Clostridia bacterium]|nr:MFS transporter [Clostridia bacterium]
MTLKEKDEAKQKNTIRFRHIESGKDKILITLLFSWTYFCSYTTRHNYKTVISAIVESENMKMDMAAAALTGLFITYAIGQLVSGWLGDRIEPKFLISGGLALSSAMNILLPLNTNVTYMTVIWCVNGFGQALIWPPIVKTMTNFLGERDYRSSVVKVLWGGNSAVVLLYLVSPLVISLTGGWKPVFYLSSAVGFAGSATAFAAITAFERKYALTENDPDGSRAADRSDRDTDGVSPKKRLRYGRTFIVCFALIIAIIAVHGALRDGVDAWTPSYISSVSGLGTDISILTGVVLPIFAIISSWLSSIVFEKLHRKEMLCCGMFFALSLVCSAVLLALRSAGNGTQSVPAVVITVLSLALIVGFMHAVGLICTCFVPGRFSAFGNISMIAGLVNFGSYAGSAAATYGFALVTEKTGWTGTVISWISLSVSGVLLCVACSVPWKKLLESAKTDGKTPQASGKTKTARAA